MDALAVLPPFTGYFPLYPAMNRASAIFTLLLLLMPPMWAQTGLKSSPASKPQIMVLAVFHLVARKDMFTQQQGDTLTDKRQREIEQLVERLRAFHPTKIAVEHDVDGKLNERYQQYLSDRYVLTADETDQYAFRLGKELGLFRIDSINYPVSYDPNEAEAYAHAHGQKAVWDASLDRARKLIEQLNEVLAHGTMLEALRFMNSEDAIDLNGSSYLVLDRVGSGNEYPGADAVSRWYATNLHIFANLMRLITSPDDRVLVIYGQGHAQLLRFFIKGSPDLQFIDPLTVLK
jgi:hypothetical protein